MPPGRARLVTRPVDKGSPLARTIGVVGAVAAAALAATDVKTTMTAGFLVASSCANAGRRSVRPSAKRSSSTYCVPSFQPSAAMASLNARVPRPSPRLPGISDPMTSGGFACARKASTHASAGKAAPAASHLRRVVAECRQLNLAMGFSPHNATKWTTRLYRTLRCNQQVVAGIQDRHCA